MNSDAQTEDAVMGELFLRAFHRLTQAVKFYQDTNRVSMDCAGEFAEIVHKWCRDRDYLAIQISRGRFLIQGEKLKFRRRNVALNDAIIAYFERRELKGFRFYDSIGESSLRGILAFARMLNDVDSQEEPVEGLPGKLEDKDLRWVEVIRKSEAPVQRQVSTRKEKARRTYFLAMASVEEVSQKIGSQGRTGIRKIKRIVQDMVDQLEQDESIFLGMSTIRDHDDYTYTHSVNVAILSLCMGRRIGLSKKSLSRLGICGLLHDLGKVEIPHAILNKPGKLTALEIKEIEKHPLRSVLQIIKLRASLDLKARILLPPLEHHMKFDHTGYPEPGREKQVSLFGRIITIADVYDAMTSPRVYRPTALGPDKALGMMLTGAGKDFDPVLLKVFFNMLGLYPVGTLVELDTREMGLVVETREGSDGDRPMVRLLLPRDEGGFRKGSLVDLNDRNPATGSYKRTLVKSFHPSIYGIQPVEFLL